MPTERAIPPLQRDWARRDTRLTLIVLATALLCGPLWALAQPSSLPAQPRTVTQASDGPNWSALTSGQKKALKPLESEWASIDGPRRVKWLEIANKFPAMSPAEQVRIQNRMAEWTKLTPRERGQARMNYREAQQVPAQERKAKWEAYNALPAEQRQQLAAKATPLPRKGSPEATSEATAAKSNVVPNSSYAPRPKAVAPTVAQAQPGATTNLITKKASPPAHQQTGLPKIAVTSGFVDQATLLPKRGPQGAATRSASASSSSPPRP